MRKMTKTQKEIAERLKFTKEQVEALEELNQAFRKCLDFGLDFVYDYDHSQVVAFNAQSVKAYWVEEIKEKYDDDDMIVYDRIGTSNLDINMDEVRYEVGPTAHYTDEYDRLCFIKK